MFRSLKISACAAIIGFLMAPAYAAGPPCPTGKVKDWQWQADRSGVELFYMGGEWNFGEGVEVPEQAPPIGYFRFFESSEGKPIAEFKFTKLPKGLTATDANGTKRELFSFNSHAYAYELAQAGHEPELHGDTNHSGASFGLFARGARFEDKKSTEALERMLKQPDLLGMLLLRPDPIYRQSQLSDYPIVFVAMSGEGRKEALAAANKAMKSVPEGGCGPTLDMLSMKHD